MKEIPELGAERAENIVITPPPVELLLDIDSVAAQWPQTLSRDAAFIEQIKERKELITNLDTVIDKLPRPDTLIKDAITSGAVPEDDAAAMYDSLVALLKDADYRRAALYIPFEFFPMPENTDPKSITKGSASNFRDAYMSAWKSLLSTYDVRANFVDGDVLEVAMRAGDLPRTVKAAHLIPKLIESGMLSKEDFFSLLESSDDSILTQSIAETIPVLADMRLITDADIDKLRSLNDAAVDMAIEGISRNTNNEEAARATPLTHESIREILHHDATNAMAHKYDGVTKKRATWLAEKEREKAIESAGKSIANAIETDRIDSALIDDLVSKDSNIQEKIALIEGIRKSVEETAEIDLSRARSLYAHYENVVISLWKDADSERRNSLSKLYRRLYRLGIVSDAQLRHHSITTPDLAKPFSNNFKYVEREFAQIKDALRSLEVDPQMRSFVYPVAIIYGSRVKGYGNEDADTDTAVFIKPGTPHDLRERIQNKLQSLFNAENIHGAITQFWLNETKEGLAVQDLEEHDPSCGEKSWTHVLFGGAWEGSEAAIKELRGKLLVPYFSDTDTMLFDREARGLYLEELERDTLQYRLMHKGYERFYPSYGGIKTLHADSIDGKSAFWDSGYRDTAIKLFASRVFLPKFKNRK